MVTASAAAKLAAEQAILGAGLIDEKVVPKILWRTTAEDFNEDYRPIWNAMKFLTGEDKKPDIISILQMLDGNHYRPILMQLMEITPTAANLDIYLEQLTVQNHLLRLREACDSFAQAPTDDRLKELSDAVSAAQNPNQRSEALNGEQRLLKWMDRMAGEKTRYIDWGFESLNREVKTEPGDYVIIGAEPSAGKTALALQLADLQVSNSWDREPDPEGKHVKCCFYSLETSEAKVTDRNIARRCGIPLAHIKDHTITDAEWTRFAETTRWYKSFDVVEAAGWRAEEIEAHAVTHGYDIIYIDYLQLVRPEKGENEYQAVTRISQALATMARRHKITVVALSQFHRTDERDPTMHSLRSSGQLEQDADAIFLLYQASDEEEDTRRLKIAKNKEGRKGQIPLFFNGSVQQFSYRPLSN